MKWFARASFLGMFPLIIAACSGGGSTSSAVPRSSGPVAWALTAGASDAQEANQGLQFYTNAITIDAGDSVTWTFPAGEPHTVTFLGNRTALPPPTDPSAAQPAGGSSYDGSTYTSSGFMLLGKTYTLTFPKPGSFTYYCILHGQHGGMVGTIIVQQSGAPYPKAQTQYTTDAQASISRDLTAASASVGEFPYAVGGTHLAAGIASGLSNAPPATSTVVRFLDSKSEAPNQSVSVHVGGTVTWTNLSNNFPHTVTFGIAGAPFPNLPPFAPPSGGPTYDGTAVTNSGVMQPGQNYSLTFTKAGTYTYHCLFHDDTENMIGTVVVR